MVFHLQLEGGYNPLKYKHQPMERTPILSEMKLTLVPPCHPDHKQDLSFSVDIDLPRTLILSQTPPYLSKHKNQLATSQTPT